jgi:hypothetical protein
MKILDDNFLAEVADNTEFSTRPGGDDKDFLESLEKMAKEVEDEPDSID